MKFLLRLIVLPVPTVCKSLGPLFTEADITRISKFLRMKPADFEAHYLRIDEDGDKVFQTMPCPFLGSDNLCSIYEVRPKACREFPHTDRKKIYQINNLTLKNTVTCPAAYLFVEKLRKKLD
jgi:Fe-S-cluster containining protein